MLTFNHSGNIGDILYSLYFCKELTEAANINKFDFHIQTNVKDPTLKNHKHPLGDVRMTNNAAEFIKPLLEAQSYINNVTISDNIAENSINLDLFRTLKINFAAGDIRAWYYNLCKQHLPREFWKPVLFVDKDTTYKNKIFISATERYQNIFLDYKVLEPYKDKLMFVGTPEEHEIFKIKYFDLQYLQCNTLLEIAKYISGAIGFIGNQCGLYSLAECLKINRILLSGEYFVYNKNIHPGPVNVHPLGNWNEIAATTEKLINSIEELLKINV